MSQTLFRLITSNAWEWVPSMNDEWHTTYKASFLSGYKIKCYVRIVEHVEGLAFNGHYGVGSIEVKHENDSPYNDRVLQEMMGAIEMAENNLLLIGIPFRPDYKFHGFHAANNKRRNDALRRKYKLDAAEELGVEIE